MLKTVEMRWFFDALPASVARFWERGANARERSDWYSMPCLPSCGIKIREGSLETKIRYASWGERSFGSVAGQLEGWKKWSLAFPPDESPSIDDLRRAGWTEVAKRRVLHLFEVDDGRAHLTATRPRNGCGFEVTQLRVADREYWTVGLETLGASDEHLEENLRLVALACLPHDTPGSPFQRNASRGYAEWLSQLAKVPMGCPPAAHRD